MLQVPMQYDVVVAGGGPGGFAAAVAAARAGAKTILVERAGSLGGAATQMLVVPFMRRQTRTGVPGEGGRILNAGVYAEVIERLEAIGGIDHSDPRFGDFDDEALKVVLDQLAAEAGVDVLFHASLYDVAAAGGRVRSLRLAHNAGPMEVAGRVFVDGTGDGLLAARAGAELLTDESARVMPVSTMFAIGGVDLDRFPDRHELGRRAARGHEDDPPLECHRMGLYRVAPNGLVYLNAIRVPARPLDPLDLSRAEAEGRRLVQNYVAWMVAHVPGCEAAKLIKTGPHIGVRETRRIRGEYVLTDDDAGTFRRFNDSIACSGYDFDIHSDRIDGRGGLLQSLPAGQCICIPYRCLVPRGVENLLVGCRALSAEALPYSSIRVMPPIYSVGQAAGMAAAMSLPDGDVRGVDSGELRRNLTAAGAVVE